MKKATRAAVCSQLTKRLRIKNEESYASNGMLSAYKEIKNKETIKVSSCRKLI